MYASGSPAVELYLRNDVPGIFWRGNSDWRSGRGSAGGAFWTDLLFSGRSKEHVRDRLFSVDENIELFNNVTRKDILKSAEMICDLSKYCGAVVTGKGLDIEELITNENQN